MFLTWLRRWFPREKRRFLLIGMGMIAFNATVLVVLVSMVGISPLAANLSRQLLTTPVHFILERRFIWPTHKHDALRKQIWRYLSLKVGSMISKQLAFFALVSWLHVPYFASYMACVVFFGLSRFELLRWFVFRRRDTE